jgi:hypothetical protein
MKDFIEFIESDAEVSPELTRRVQEEIRLSFRKKEILKKFVGFYFLGAAISLCFCPQFGLGLVGGHGISHFFRQMGDWVCAAFCGSLLLSLGMASVFMNLKLDEINWVWVRYKVSLIFLPTLAWMILMLLNVTFQRPPEAVSYHFSWILFAVITQSFLLILGTRIHQGRTHET